MASKRPPKVPKELLEAVSPSTIEFLSGMAGIATSASADDTSAAIREGAVLLAIARVDNDEDGYGFRYLIGLPRGVAVTPYLGSYFG